MDMKSRATLLSAADAVARIPDGATVAIGGFVGAGHPEALTSALEARFLATGTPRDLTLVYAAGQGDREHRGLNHLAHAGLLKRVIGGHWNLAPKLGRMALAGEMEAYNLPQGIICALFREIAAGRPGVFSKVGLNTFIDPQNGGGKLNSRTTQDLVERIDLDGEIWLRYRSFPITVALIRATRADCHANLTIEDEGIIGESLAIAQAVHNSGGRVIAQVKTVTETPAEPMSVAVPGILVDSITQADLQLHWQTFGEEFNRDYTHPATRTTPELSPIPFSERKIIARRALQEIHPGAIVNLGIGLPEAIAAVAAESGRLDEFTLTVESGPIGGIPASGLSFGCSTHPQAIIDQPSQFDFYDGGGIDVSALGAVEVDAVGNVSVSTLGNRFAGVGGFVNISRSASTLVFCFTFTAGGLRIAVNNGCLAIQQEGAHAKFINRTAQVCFHGASACQNGQKVLFVTERAVFDLTPNGIRLIEIAPGIDVEKDILPFMPFQPIIDTPQRMPASIFVS